MQENKVALVTGGSRGIGRACALKLAEAGVNVVINYAGNDEAAEKTVKDIEAFGVKAAKKKFNVADKEAVDNAIKEIIEEFGKIDILVNNAGITRDGLFMRMSETQWLDVINTNLNSAYFVTNPVSKLMIKQRSGAIINMASISGIYGNAGQANYSTAKAGLIGFTKALAKELASRNIRVNAVAPGFIKTAMTEGLDNNEIYQHIPLRRMGEAEDIATVIKFLAEDATYVTGQVIGVDGGLVV